MKVIERVLVVDRSELIRQTVGRVLRTRGIAVAEAGTLALAWKYLEADHFQMVLAGDILPDGEGVTLVRDLAARIDAPYIISLLEKSSPTGIEQQRDAGAHEVVVRPFAERDLRDFFDRARRHLASPPSPAPVAATVKAASPRNGVQILGRSPATQHLRDYICRVAPTNATVLIQGESGTGKELVARALHQQSPRSNGPFVKLNCAALPESLVESELFGHERGAFTGAINRREGRFGMANGGTLLLDEVTEVSLAVQAKLLRVIQEREYERVGGNDTLPTDVRLVATTNRSLEESVERGEFRSDLFFRLNVVTIHLPALRERPGDVPILAERFLEEFCGKHNKAVCGFTPEAMEWLVAHPWPGNIRELQNMIERGVVANPDGPIGLDSLVPFRFRNPPPAATRKSTPPKGRASKAGPAEKPSHLLFEIPSAAPQSATPLKDLTLPMTQLSSALSRTEPQVTAPPPPDLKSLSDLEREHIIRIMEYAKNDLVRAAEILKISPPQLREKLRNLWE